MISPFIRHYLAKQSPSNNREKENIIKSLLDKNRIEKKDVSRARSILRVYK